MYIAEVSTHSPDIVESRDLTITHQRISPHAVGQLCTTHNSIETVSMVTSQVCEANAVIPVGVERIWSVQNCSRF